MNNKERLIAFKDYAVHNWELVVPRYTPLPALIVAAPADSLVVQSLYKLGNHLHLISGKYEFTGYDTFALVAGILLGYAIKRGLNLTWPKR